MAIVVRKATRRKAKLRLGIAAPAGAGKTMGALIIAYGLVGDWEKIGLLDTEKGSGELYEGQTVPGTNLTIGAFQYVGIEEPYTVAKYMEGQKALEAAGCEVIILDSTSHAWAGAGGLLDKQGKIAARTGNSYTAWRDVTPDHNAFVDAMLSSPSHIIATMRSKTEYVQEKNEQGKTMIRKVGMAPVQREGLDFEFTIVLDIDHAHTASASKDRTTIFDGLYFKITVDTGKKLRDWLENGAPALPPAPAPKPELPIYHDEPQGPPQALRPMDDVLTAGQKFAAALRLSDTREEGEKWVALNPKDVWPEKAHKSWDRAVAMMRERLPETESVE